MKKKALNTVIAILLLFTHGTSYSQHPLPAFIKDSLDGYIERALRGWQIPGLALCIVKNGDVVVMKGYGVKEVNTNNSVDENTLFMIGSNTKAFTSTALAMLHNEKKLSLDDKVTKWIPGFRLENTMAGEQAIIRDLLCHRIGFKTFQGDFTYWTSNLTRKDVIERMGRIKALYPFRTNWGYTNAGFVCAGEIIPKASGMLWEDFIRERMFKPLGMNSSMALSKDLLKADNKSAAHTIDGGRLIKIPYCDIDNLAAAGSISSSVSDMSKWVTMQLNNGKVADKQVIATSALRQTQLPHSILGNGGYQFNRGHFLLYGLGWFLEEYSGRKIVSHTGGVNGFVSGVTLIPEEQLGIIILTNTDQNNFFDALKWEIIDAYLGNAYRNYGMVNLGSYQAEREKNEKADKALRDSAALKQKPRFALDAYTGTYFNEVYGNIGVLQQNGQLKMNFHHHPGMYATLDALGGNRFYATFTDPVFGKAVFPFTEENGKITSVKVKVADFIEYDPYHFIKKIK